MIRCCTSLPCTIASLSLCVISSLFVHVSALLCWSRGQKSYNCEEDSYHGCFFFTKTINYEADTFGLEAANTDCSTQANVKPGEKLCEFPKDKKASANCYCNEDDCNDVSKEWPEYLKAEYKKHYNLSDLPSTTTAPVGTALLSTGGIIGISVGIGFILLVVGLVLFYFCYYKKKHPHGRRAEKKASGAKLTPKESKSNTNTNTEFAAARYPTDVYRKANDVEKSNILETIETMEAARSYAASYNGLLQLKKKTLTLSRKPYNITGYEKNLFLCECPVERTAGYFFRKASVEGAKAIVMAMDVTDLKGDVYYPRPIRKSSKPEPLSYVDHKSEITVNSSPKISIGDCEKTPLHVKVGDTTSDIAHYMIRNWITAHSFKDGSSTAIDDLVVSIGDVLREAENRTIIIHCIDGTTATAAVAVSIDIVRRVLAGQSNVDPIKVAEAIASDRPQAIASRNEFLLAIVVALKVMEKMVGDLPANAQKTIADFEQSCKALAKEALEKQTKKKAIAETWSTEGETADSGRAVAKKKNTKKNKKSKKSKDEKKEKEAISRMMASRIKTIEFPSPPSLKSTVDWTQESGPAN